MAKKIQIDLQVKDKGSKEIKKFSKTTATSFKGIEQSAKKMNDGFSKITRTLKLMSIATAALVAIKLVSFMKDSVEAASDLEEAMGKFSVVFAGQEELAASWAKTLVDSYAMSRREAAEYLSSVQDLLVPMGMAADAAGDMSFEVVKLSADLGSFNNLPTARVMGDIQSALVGNFETMKKYGVVLNATVVQEKAMAMSLVKTKDSLTAAHKAQAAYKLMVEGSQAAVGDMARTYGSYANVLKRYNRTMENLKSTLGKALLGPLTKAVEKLNEWVKANEEIIGQNFAELIEKLADAMVKLADAMIAANTWTKEHGTTWEWIKGLGIGAFFLGIIGSMWKMTSGVREMVGSLKTFATEAKTTTKETARWAKDGFSSVTKEVTHHKSVWKSLLDTIKKLPNTVSGAMEKVLPKLTALSRVLNALNILLIDLAFPARTATDLEEMMDRFKFEAFQGGEAGELSGAGGTYDTSELVKNIAAELKLEQSRIDAINKIRSQLVLEDDLDSKAEETGELKLIKQLEELFIRKSELLGENQKAELAAEHYRYKYFVEANGKILGAAEVHAMELQAIRKKYALQGVQVIAESLKAEEASRIKRVNILLENDAIIRKAHEDNLQRMSERWKEANAHWTSIGNSFVDSIADAFGNMASGAKDVWETMAQSMLAEITRIIVKMMILRTLTQSFGGYSGFVGNLVGSIAGKAAGGPVQKTTPYLVGERGPELFIPNQSGNITPNDKLGSDQSQSQPVLYNININAVDADSFEKLSRRNPEAIITPIIEALQKGHQPLRGALAIAR